MKTNLLLSLLTAVVLTACGGGGGTDNAATQAFTGGGGGGGGGGGTEIRVTRQAVSNVATAQETAFVQFYQAAHGQAPGNSFLTTAKANNYSDAFYNVFNSIINSQSDAELAKTVLKNLNISATTLNSTAQFGTAAVMYANLEAAVTDYFKANGKGTRVTVIRQLAGIVAGMENETTFGVYGNAAIAFNKQVAANYTYSSNTANVSGAVVAVTVKLPPIPVYKTSYENKNKAKFDLPQILNAFDLGLVKTVGNEKFDYFEWRSIAFADFTQEGKYTIVQAQNVFDAAKMAAGVTRALPAKLVFLQKNGDNYVDVTNKLIPVAADQRPCFAPGDPIIADFNGDGKPDIFLTCGGGNGDFVDTTGFTQAQLAELLTGYQSVYLSQVDGTLKKAVVPYKFYGHGGSAADLNGDGYVDVIVTNPVYGLGATIIALINDGKGNFTADYTRFNINNKAIYTLELLDVGRGVVDVIAGGDAAGTYDGAIDNLWLKNDGTGKFLNYVALPKVTSKKSGKIYELVLDVLYSDGFLYMTIVGNAYKDNAIVKINLATLTAQTIWEKLTAFSDAWVDGDKDFGYISKMVKDNNNNLVPMMACRFKSTDPKYGTSICGVRGKT